ncbi:MAG: type II toxin-antitoxin system MqsR family toxin [Proteobacteria bacterium]|jgi:motility quorum-sensing regulator/GCU-specific mRNA interferase toxin|nr:type II toxin-antitoxin system MqsR family toxin [Pseudomonadota bacterium]
MAAKRNPHHALAAIQTKFATVAGLEITRVATENARALGYGLQDVVDAVQALQGGDFIKSETAHSPPNSKVWHDTYNLPWDGRVLFLKFAGETLIDLTLTSFKETGK